MAVVGKNHVVFLISPGQAHIVCYDLTNNAGEGRR